MKYFLLYLLLIVSLHVPALLAATTIANRGPVVIVVASYDLTETFEASEYDNSWTEDIATDGVVNGDYTTEALAGSQSLLLDEGAGGDVSTYNAIGTNLTDMWFYFMFQVDVGPGANTTGRVILKTGNTSPVLQGVALDFTSTGAVIQLKPMSGGTSGTATTDSFAVGDTIHIWCHINNPADTVEVWWNTSATRPTTGGTKYSILSTAFSTTSNRAYITNELSTAVYIFDKFIYDSAEIGSNP